MCSFYGDTTLNVPPESLDFKGHGAVTLEATVHTYLLG